MNSHQRITFFAAGTLVLLLCLFPPYEIAYPLNDAVVFPSNSLVQTFQRSFIFQQPTLIPTSFEKTHPQYASFRVWNTNQLFFECLLVIAIAGALLLVVSNEFVIKPHPIINQKLLAIFLILLFGIGLFWLWFGWLGYVASFLLRLNLLLIILAVVFGFYGSFINIARIGTVGMKNLLFSELALVGIWVVSSVSWFLRVAMK